MGIAKSTALTMQSGLSTLGSLLKMVKLMRTLIYRAALTESIMLFGGLILESSKKEISWKDWKTKR